MTHPFERSVEDTELSASGDDAPPSTSERDTTEADETPTVDALVRERDEYKDRLLRATADFDNYRRRVTRERGELVEHVAADVLGEILPIVDDLERALSAADETERVERYREGVEITYRHLLDVLKKRGVTPIEALGADFDPHLHHAVAHEPSAAHRDGEVMAELRKGYKLADRLLRASLVKVASRE
ncbi:MAG: nucleotide exchange factor GrpE [Luteitalea sp.]|nr:nucleotide exchange factor GrpE [Luteitalea sp.]